MITITCHFILFVLIEIIGYEWARRGDNGWNSLFGMTSRDFRIGLWIILSIIGTLIYGGIFWW